MGHSLEDVLAGLQDQLQQIEDELAPIEQQLSSDVLAVRQRQGLTRLRGRLLHRRQLLGELIADLTGRIKPQQ